MTEKDRKADYALVLEHGEPLVLASRLSPLGSGLFEMLRNASSPRASAERSVQGGELDRPRVSSRRKR